VCECVCVCVCVSVCVCVCVCVCVDNDDVLSSGAEMDEYYNNQKVLD
jgi:hypothetical protein